jgi:hypothetical protein
MSDITFAGQFYPQIVIATATDANPNAQANLGGVWASSDSGATWTHIVLPGSCSLPVPRTHSALLTFSIPSTLPPTAVSSSTQAWAPQTGLSRAIGGSSVPAG